MPSLREICDLMDSGRWTESHDGVQRDASSLAAWLHGLLHLQEGDLEDAENWYNRAGRHFRSRGSLEEELELFKDALSARDHPESDPQSRIRESGDVLNQGSERVEVHQGDLAIHQGNAGVG